MADVQITKIIVLRGFSADLPQALDPGELAYSTNEGRMFIGCDPTSGQPQYARTTFPYQNIEILTENSTTLFAKMHGDRMKEGNGADYYDARLEASQQSWVTIQVSIDEVLNDYRINDIASVSAFIDYVIANNDGVPIRLGNMHLTYYAAGETDPFLTDNGSYRRDLTLVSDSNYDPTQTFGAYSFRFKVDGPLNAPYLTFQYRNVSADVANLRFKVSRPEAVYYQGAEPVVTDPDAPTPTTNLLTSTAYLSFTCSTSIYGKVVPNSPFSLVNGNFEQGLVGWLGEFQVRAASIGSGTPIDGVNIGWSGNVALGTIYQDLLIPNIYLTNIDAGLVKISQFSGYHLSYAGQTDHANLFVAFLNGSGTEISRAQTPEDSSKTWALLVVPDTFIPAGTRTLRFGMYNTRDEGSENNNDWDSLTAGILIGP